MDWFKLWASLVTLLLLFMSAMPIDGRPEMKSKKEKRQSTRGGVKSFDDVLPFVEEATGSVFTVEQKREAQRIIGKITKDIVEGKVKEDLEHHIQDLEKMLTAVTGFEIDLGMNVKNLIAPTITFENLKYASALLHKVREGKMDIRAAMSEIRAFLKKGFDVDLMDEATKKEMSTLLESMDEMANSGNIDEFAWRALHIRIIFFLKKYDQKVKDIETNEIDRSSSAYKSMIDNSRKLYRLIYKWRKSDPEDTKRVEQLRSTVKKLEDSGLMENYTAAELKKRMKQFMEQHKKGYNDQGLLKPMGNIAMYNLFSNNEPLQPKEATEIGSSEKTPARKSGGGSRTILHKTIVKHKKSSKMHPHTGEKSSSNASSKNGSVTVENINWAAGSKFGSKGKQYSNEKEYASEEKIKGVAGSKYKVKSEKITGTTGSKNGTEEKIAWDEMKNASGEKIKGAAGSKYGSEGKHGSNKMQDTSKKGNSEKYGSSKTHNSKENTTYSGDSGSQETLGSGNKLGSNEEQSSNEHSGFKKGLHSGKTSGHRKVIVSEKHSKKGSSKGNNSSSGKVPGSGDISDSEIGSRSGETNGYGKGSASKQDEEVSRNYQDSDEVKNSYKKHGSGSTENNGSQERHVSGASSADASDSAEEGASEGSTEEQVGSKEGFSADEPRSDEQSNHSKSKQNLKNPAINIDADVAQTQVSGTINSFDDIIPFVEATKGIEFPDEDKKVIQEFIARIKTGILQGVPKKEMTKFVVDLQHKLKQLTDYDIDILKIADDLYTPTETFELLKQLKSLIDRLAKGGGGSESGIIILKIGDMIKKLKKSNMLEEEEKTEIDELYKDIKKNGKIDHKGSKTYSTTISAVLKRYNQSMDQNPADTTFATLNELRNLLRSVIQKVKDGNMEELVGDLAEMKSLILTLKNSGGLKVTETEELDKTLDTLKKTKKKNGDIDLSAFEVMAEYVEQLARQNNIPYDATTDKNLGIGDLAPMLLTLMKNHGTDDSDPHKLLPQIHRLILKLIKDQNIDNDVKKELDEHFTILNDKYQKSEKIDLHELEILAVLVEKISQLLSHQTGLMAALKGAQELLHPSQMFDVQIITQIKLLRRSEFDEMEDLISLVKNMIDATERGDTIDKSSVQKFINAVNKTLKSRAGQDGLYSSGAFATLDELLPHIESIAKKKLSKREKKGINRKIAKLKSCAEKGAKFEISDDCMKIVTEIEKRLENATGTLIDLHSHIKEFLQFTYLKDSLEQLIPILKTALSGDVDIISSIHGGHNLGSIYRNDDGVADDGINGGDEFQSQGTSKRESGAVTVTLTLDDLVPYVENTIGIIFNATDRAVLDLMINKLKHEVEKSTNENEIVALADRIESKLMDITGYKIDIGSITENLIEPSGENSRNDEESQHITYSNSIDDLNDPTAHLNEDEVITKIKKHRAKRYLDSRELNMLADKIEESAYDYPGSHSDKSISEDVISYDADDEDPTIKRATHDYYEKISPLGYGDVNVFLDSKDLKLLADTLDNQKISKYAYNYKDSKKTGKRTLVNVPYNKTNKELYTNNGDLSVINGKEAISNFNVDQLLDDGNSDVAYDDFILATEKDLKLNKLTPAEKLLSGESDTTVNWQETIERNDPLGYSAYEQISNQKLLNTEDFNADKLITSPLTLESERNRQFRKLQSSPAINEYLFNTDNEEYLIVVSSETNNQMTNPETNKLIGELINSNDEVEGKNKMINQKLDESRNVQNYFHSENNEIEKETFSDELENKMDSDDDDVVDNSNDGEEKIQESIEDRNHESKENNKFIKESEAIHYTDTSKESKSIVDARDEKNIYESKEDDESTADTKSEEVNRDSKEENEVKYNSKENEMVGHSNEDNLKSSSDEDKILENKSNESGLDDDNVAEENSYAHSNSIEDMLNKSSELDAKDDVESQSNEDELNQSNESNDLDAKDNVESQSNEDELNQSNESNDLDAKDDVESQSNEDELNQSNESSELDAKDDVESQSNEDELNHSNESSELDAKDDVESQSNGDELHQSNESEPSDEVIVNSNEQETNPEDKLEPLEDNNNEEDYLSPSDKDSQIDGDNHVETVETGVDSRNIDTVSQENNFNNTTGVNDKELVSVGVRNDAQGNKTDYNLGSDNIHMTKELTNYTDELLNNSKKSISENLTLLSTGIDIGNVPNKAKLTMDNVLPSNNNNLLKTVETSPSKTFLTSNPYDTLTNSTDNTFLTSNPHANLTNSTANTFLTSNPHATLTNSTGNTFLTSNPHATLTNRTGNTFLTSNPHATLTNNTGNIFLTSNPHATLTYSTGNTFLTSNPHATLTNSTANTFLTSNPHATLTNNTGNTFLTSNPHATLTNSTGNTELTNIYNIVDKNRTSIKALENVSLMSSNQNQESKQIENLHKTFTSNQPIPTSGNDKTIVSDLEYIPKSVLPLNSQTLANHKISTQIQQVVPIQPPSILQLLSGSKTYAPNPQSGVVPSQPPSNLQLLSGSKTYAPNPQSGVVSDMPKQSNLGNNSVVSKRSSVITKEIPSPNEDIHISQKRPSIVQPWLNNPADVQATKKQFGKFDNGIHKVEGNTKYQAIKRDAKHLKTSENDELQHTNHDKNMYKGNNTDEDESSEEHSSEEEDNQKQEKNEKEEHNKTQNMEQGISRNISESADNYNNYTALDVTYLDLQSLMITFESLAMEQDLGKEAMDEVYQIKRMVPDIVENVHNEEERDDLISDIYSRISESVQLLRANRPSDSGLKDFKTYITFVKALALHGMDKPLDAHSMLKNLSIVTLNEMLKRCLPKPLANDIVQLQKVVWDALNMDTDFPDDHDTAKLKAQFKDMFDIATKTKNLIHDKDSYDNCVKIQK